MIIGRLVLPDRRSGYNYVKLLIVLIFFSISFSQCILPKAASDSAGFNGNNDLKKFEYEYSLNEGIKYRLLEDFPRAVYFFNRCIELFPDSDVAYYELSNIYLAIGEDSASLNFANKALELDPQNKWYYYQVTMILQKQNNIDQAIKVFKEAVNRFPGETNMKFRLASLFALKGQFTESLKIYDQLGKKFGLDERISLARQNLYMQAGQFEKAHEEISILIEAFPGEPRYYGILAELYAALDMYEEALESYSKLFEIDPGNGIAQMSVAEFFLVNEQPVESIYYLTSAFQNPDVDPDEKFRFFSAIIENKMLPDRFYKDIIKLGNILVERYPNNDIPWILLSEFYINSQNYDEAGELLYELYSGNKNNILYAEQLVGVMNLNGNHSEIVNLGDEMIDLFPQSILIHYYTAASNHFLGNSRRAVEIFHKCLEIDEVDDVFFSHIYGFMGEIFNDQQDYSQSDKYFNLALEADSNNIITLNNYAYFLALREEKLETALSYSYTTIQMDPENSSFLDTYAWILYKLGEYEKAEEYIELAYINGGSTSFEIVKHYAAILIKLEKYNDAENYLNLAIKLGGEEDIQQLDEYFERVVGKTESH